MPKPSPPGSNYSAESTDVSATLSGLTSGATYHYRFAAENENGKNVGIDRTVVPAFVLQLQTLPATDVSTSGATFNASLDPDGKETEYWFEYGLTSDYGLETATKRTASSVGTTTVGIPVASLPSGRTFHYRVVADNFDGTTTGPDQVVRIASPPDIASVRVSDMSDSTAVLHADINPVGYDTHYFFEYGPGTEYGQLIPAAPDDLGEGTAPIAITQTATNLQPGLTYHFRVVAKNKWGTTESADTTFDFSPPVLPERPRASGNRGELSARLPGLRARLDALLRLGAALPGPAHRRRKQPDSASTSRTTPGMRSRPTRASPRARRGSRSSAASPRPRD